MKLSAEESRLEVIVRSTEIDVNGHVNNAKYLEYLEWGREDFYEQANLPYDALLAQGVVTVTVNINVNYRKEARQGDNLIVITRPLRVGRTSFAIEQRIERRASSSAAEMTDDLVADAVVTLVTVDPQTRRPVPVPPLLRQHFCAQEPGGDSA
ncbi:MAG: thioesterase family protein [Firmicutes bacterium]|nr:thioesterase family protein [Bacillota bacterium]